MIRRLVHLMLFCVTIVAVAAGVSTLIPQRQNGLLIFAASLLPWLFVISIIALALTFVLRMRALTVLFTLCVVLLGGMLAPLFVPKAHAANTDAPALRVLSYSTWATNRDVNADAIARMIVSARADVVALQEIDAKTLANIQAALMTLDPKSTWHFVADFEIDLATLSRLPISITKVEALRTRLLQAQVLTSVGPVTIWNIHAFRPDFKQSGLSFLAYGGGDVAQPDTTGQIDWLADAASKVTEPMVLMGDFNFPYLSPDHRWLSRALRDAHWEAEWGFGFTFPASDAHARRINVFGRRFAIASPMRLAKIDHIFYNAHLVVREAHTLADSAGSDHAPVIAEFAL